jgi:hypothetical protein
MATASPRPTQASAAKPTAKPAQPLPKTPPKVAPTIIVATPDPFPSKEGVFSPNQ